VFDFVPVIPDNLLCWRGCRVLGGGDAVKPTPEKCERCLYTPGTDDDRICPYDCNEMAKGYLALKSDVGARIIGRVYPSKVEFIPIIAGATVDSAAVPFFSGYRPNRKGWICPKCDEVISPDEKTCPNCKPKPKKENSDGEPTHIAE
jgi:RNA polymerase subunit RPABC4/transcription elongation factor Spt4